MGLTTSFVRRSAPATAADTGERRVIAFCAVCWWPRFWVQTTNDEARQGFVHETCVADAAFVGPEPRDHRPIRDDLDVVDPVAADRLGRPATTADRDSQTNPRVVKCDVACGDHGATRVDASTQTNPAAVEVPSDDRTDCSVTTDVVGGIEETRSVPGVDANTVTVDGGRPAAVFVAQDDGPSAATVCAADMCPGSNDGQSRSDDGDGSEEKKTDVGDVPPVMGANHAEELNVTYRPRENQFGQLSRSDEDIITDRETLYSGIPEVLANLIALRCKSLDTVIDPFCGSGAIAIQLAKVCRKVIVMDKDLAKIAFARNSARVYGVEDKMVFLVGDIFDHEQSLKKVDGIITSPPGDMSKEKMEKFIEIANRVSTKVLLKFPKKKEKSDLYRIGSKKFNHIRFEDITIDSEPNSILMYLGPGINRNHNLSRRKVVEGPQKKVLLFSGGLSVSPRVNFNRGNNRSAYINYQKSVENCLKI